MKTRHLATIDAAVDAWLGVLKYLVVGALVLAAFVLLWSAFGPQPKSVPCYATPSGAVCSTVRLEPSQG